MEVFISLLLSALVITFGIICTLYQSKKEKQNIICHLNNQINSLGTELNDSKEEARQLITSLQDTNKSLDDAITKNNAYDLLFSSLTENLKKERQENNSLTESLEKARQENVSINKKIYDLKQQKITAEKTLYEAQLSYLKMEKCIQREYDSSIEKSKENFTYIASLMADYLTLNIKKAQDDLKISDKYHERQRAKKIVEIRAEAKEIITTYKEAQYQLDYLLTMFPELNAVINDNIITDLSIEDINKNYEIFNDDPVSGYITRAEWEQLSSTERNQLALDRYLQRTKSNWEIGRDYELYIAHLFEEKGYSVDTFGSYMRINDLGRDLIAKRGHKTKVIQCKYWSSQKEIHENHICQLYGTVICYCIENNLTTEDVDAVFITSTTLTKKALEFANMLKIQVKEKIPLEEFPRIKCNIGHDDWGETKIYHLPMDSLYDKVKISKKGERYCYSVYEAESLGFRRAYKWHGN